MLIFAEIPLSLLFLRTDVRPELNQKIIDQPDTQALFVQLRQEGILDPLLIRKDSRHYLVETGVQRTLFAREAGLETLKAFIYNLPDCAIDLPGETITSREQVQARFRHPETPCLIDILGYLDDGVISF